MSPALLAAALLVTAIHAASARGGVALAGEVLAKLRTTNALEPLPGNWQLSVIDQFGARPIYRLNVPVQARLNDTITALRSSSGSHCLQARLMQVKQSANLRAIRLLSPLGRYWLVW